MTEPAFATMASATLPICTISERTSAGIADSG